MSENNKIITLKLSLTDKPISSIIDIDPITRLNLINEKQSINKQITKPQQKDKSFFINKYKQIAENLDKLVATKEHQKKVTKKSKKPQTISFNIDDLAYDVSKYDNPDESNHIIINNIDDSKLKINISNIINKEIEKSTQKSTSFKQPLPFATPADKVINFNTERVSKPQNEEEQPARKRKMNAGTIDSKKVSFDTNEQGDKGLSFFGASNNSSGSGFGLKRNKDSEEVKKDDAKPVFGFGASTEKKDDAKPVFGFGASTEKKDDAKPVFGFGASTEKKEDAKPVFGFGASTEKKDDAKPVFGFGASTEKKEDAKPVFGFGASTGKKEDAKPVFGFGASTGKKEDAKPVFGFGASTGKKEDAKPVFGFGASTGKKEDAKPAFLFGGNTEKKEDAKPAFGFGATSDKKEDTKPALSFGAATDKKEDTKSAFGFGATTEKKEDTKSAFGFGATTEKKDDTNSAFSFGAATERKEDSKPAFSFGSTTEKKDEPKPAFGFGSNTAAKPPATTAPSAFSFGASNDTKPAAQTASSAFSFGATKGPDATSGKTTSRFEGFGASGDASKPKSRFDPAPVSKPAASAFNFGASQPAPAFGAPAAAKPAAVSPFGSNTPPATTMPGFSRFDNKTPVNQATSQQPTNPALLKPVSGFNFQPQAQAQPHLLSGLTSSNTSQSPGQLNFNINNKFKSLSPPQQPPSFQPGGMNFSFGGSLPAGNMGGQQPPSNNMSFGGFGGQQPQSNGAVNGRRIAKLRKR